MTERIVETWEGVSPTRGPVRVDILDLGAGRHHYQPRFADGLLAEVKTIGLGTRDSARHFALQMGYACRDVPEWRCATVVLCGVEITAPVDGRSWPAPITPYPPGSDWRWHGFTPPPVPRD